MVRYISAALGIKGFPGVETIATVNFSSTLNIIVQIGVVQFVAGYVARLAIAIRGTPVIVGDAEDTVLSAVVRVRFG